MDPFDEFEFKPLTEGLGFHRKKVDLKKETKESKTFDNELSRYIPEAPPELADISPKSSALTPKKIIIEPQLSLQKKAEPERERTEPQQTEAQQEVERILADFKNSRAQAQLSHSIQKEGMIEAPRPSMKWLPGTPSVVAFTLDLIAVAALNLIGLIILLAVTKADLTLNLVRGDLMVYLSLASMVFGIYWMYMTIARSFAGQSLGEWAFEYRAGTEGELMSKTYTLRVAWRSALVLITGGLTLPLLSYLFRRDLAGDLSGVHLTKRRIHGAGA